MNRILSALVALVAVLITANAMAENVTIDGKSVDIMSYSCTPANKAFLMGKIEEKDQVAFRSWLKKCKEEAGGSNPAAKPEEKKPEEKKPAPPKPQPNRTPRSAPAPQPQAPPPALTVSPDTDNKITKLDTSLSELKKKLEEFEKKQAEADKERDEKISQLGGDDAPPSTWTIIWVGWLTVLLPAVLLFLAPYFYRRFHTGLQTIPQIRAKLAEVEGDTEAAMNSAIETAGRVDALEARLPPPAP